MSNLEEQKLAEQIRKHCADALLYLSAGIRFPRISRDSLEEAQRHIGKAVSVAAVLDPEEQS